MSKLADLAAAVAYFASVFVALVGLVWLADLWPVPVTITLVVICIFMIAALIRDA